MEERWKDIAKQLAIAVAGSIITVLLLAIWGWVSAGGLVGLLGGLNVNNFSEKIGDSLKAELQGKWEKDLRRLAREKMDDLPEGTIIAWYPQSGDIPDGWVICDGDNFTPDLRNRFLRGGGSPADVKSEVARGGQETVTMVARTVTVFSVGGNDRISKSPNGGPEVGQSWGSEKWHGLTSTGQIEAYEFETLPPYQAVLFIMKTFGRDTDRL